MSFSIFEMGTVVTCTYVLKTLKTYAILYILLEPKYDMHILLEPKYDMHKDSGNFQQFVV